MPSSRSELLALPPLVAAALGVFLDGGYSATPRIVFACAGAAAGGIAVAVDRRPLREPLALTLLGLALLGAVSVLWTLGTEERTLRWAAVTLGYLGVFVAAAVAGRTREGRNMLAAGIALIAAAAALVGLGAWALHDRPYALEIGGGWRPAGPFEYPPALALLMVSALPVYVAAARRRRRALFAAGLAGAALTGAVLALAGSRTGLVLGLAIGAGALWRHSRAAAVTLVLVAALAAPLVLGPGDGPSSGFLHGREDTWSAGVDTFLDRPLLGAGADAFLAGSARHQDGAAILFAHDLPLELAAELGVAGLLLALALYAATARLAWAARTRQAGWLFGPAALAFMASSLLDWPWHLAGSGAIWALAAGGLAAGTRAYTPKAPKLETRPNQGDS